MNVGHATYILTNFVDGNSIKTILWAKIVSLLVYNDITLRYLVHMNPFDAKINTLCFWSIGLSCYVDVYNTFIEVEPVLFYCDTWHCIKGIRLEYNLTIKSNRITALIIFKKYRWNDGSFNGQIKQKARPKQKDISNGNLPILMKPSMNKWSI